jgi:predicted amidohydrolase
MSEITVALVQMAPHLAQQEENLRDMVATIERICHEQPVDLIVFPELSTTGYECGLRFTDMAEKLSGHVVSLLAQSAADFNVHLAFGMVVKERVESIIYDAAVLIGPDGEVLGDYRKVHLKGEEQMAFRAGYRFPVMETAFGQVGLLVGWDLAFPEAARCLTLDGAQLICICANWEQEQMEEWRAYCVARASENSVFLAAANRIGEEPGYTFGGESMIVGPGGELYALMEGADVGYAVAKIRLTDVRRLREERQQIQCRRPQAYRAVVRKY